MTFWDVLIAIHLLAMAFFVGGQLVLATVLVPVLKGKPEMKETAKRFGMTSGVALIVIILTGIYLAQHDHDWSNGNLWAKIILLVVLLGLLGYHIKEGQKRWIDPVLFVISIAIVVLGVVLAN
jgi:putative copper export protein